MSELELILQLAELFDGIEDVIAWVKDREGKYVWVNQAFAVNYALSAPRSESPVHPEEIIGKTDYDLSPSGLADAFRADDQSVLAGNRIMNRLELVALPDGSTTWSVTDKVPIRDAKKGIIAVAGITRPLAPGAAAKAIKSGLPAALALIRESFRLPLSNTDLANAARMSVRAFERKFRSDFHVSPQEYLRRLRMQMACRALVYTSESLAEIASACGFADQSHFTREFRRRMGETPRGYRDRSAFKPRSDGPGKKTAAF